MVLKVFGPGVVRIFVGFGLRLLAHPKIFSTVGSEIFQPKVYSWEPSWYFGGGFKRKHFVAGAWNGARSADFVARGGVGGSAAPPHAARIKSLF